MFYSLIHTNQVIFLIKLDLQSKNQNNFQITAFLFYDATHVLYVIHHDETRAMNESHKFAYRYSNAFLIYVNIATPLYI